MTASRDGVRRGPDAIDAPIWTVLAPAPMDRSRRPPTSSSRSDRRRRRGHRTFPRYLYQDGRVAWRPAM